VEGTILKPVLKKAQSGYYGADSPFDSIRLGDQDVRVVTLSTPQEQAQGFQHHKNIPKTYGYMFPNRGDGFFHMQNCPAQILMIALDDNKKVVGKEIRNPETLGKQVAGGKGKHILELHPLYDPYVQVGQRLGEKVKAQAVTNNYWLCPDLSIHPCTAHYEFACKQFNIARDKFLNDPDSDELDPYYQQLFHSGFVRVVEDNGNIYYEGKPTSKQLKELKDLSIERGLELRKGIRKAQRQDYEKEQVGQRIGARPEPQQDRGWLKPSGEFLSIPKSHEEFLIKNTKFDRMYPIQDAFKAGWVRVTNVMNSLIAHSPQGINSKQKRELINIALECDYNKIEFVDDKSEEGFGKPRIIWQREERDSSLREARRPDYGWLTPDGKFLPCTTNHLEFLKKHGLAGSYEEAMYKGFVRITFFHNDLFGCNYYLRLKPQQKTELRNLAIEGGYDRLVFDNGKDDIVLWSKGDRVGQYSKSRKFWINPSGNLIPLKLNHSSDWEEMNQAQKSRKRSDRGYI
jgi:uncharacterized membrane protein (UPF0127 family)